jgi:hypothetical protein
MSISGRIMKMEEAFLEKPVFVLTSDQDWASDYCVDSFTAFTRQHGLTPTLFVTNDSPAIKALKTTGHAELGIHPNFLPGSTHGATTAGIIDHTLAIVSNPVAVRCHSFCESSPVLNELLGRGLRVDSNLCLFMQAGIRPLQRGSGLLCLPVFWEDDVHWDRGFGWDFEHYRALFFTPGLKIINVHPFNFALNISDAAFYKQHKPHITTLDAETAVQLRHKGPGAATFLADLIAAIRAEGYPIMTFSDIVRKLQVQWVEPDSGASRACA